MHAALRSAKTGFDAFGRPVGGIAGNVPSSLANNRDIDAILRAADEIQDDDPNVSRICKLSYMWLHYFTVWFLQWFSCLQHVYVVIGQKLSYLPRYTCQKHTYRSCKRYMIMACRKLKLCIIV